MGVEENARTLELKDRERKEARIRGGVVKSERKRIKCGRIEGERKDGVQNERKRKECFGSEEGC